MLSNHFSRLIDEDCSVGPPIVDVSLLSQLLADPGISIVVDFYCSGGIDVV